MDKTRQYIRDNEPFLAEYDEGGYLGTDEASLAEYLENYYQFRQKEEQTSKLSEESIELLRNLPSCRTLNRTMIDASIPVAIGIWDEPGNEIHGEVMTVCFEGPDNYGQFWSDENILGSGYVTTINL